MSYLTLSEIQEVHIEHTSKCNLLCPKCARVVDGKKNPELPLKTLDLSDYENTFSKSLCRQIKHLYFCGNYGDPAAASNFLDCVEFLRKQGVPRISVFSNGSLQTAKWWQQLAKILNQPKDFVNFSIDGLEDTNHLYRKNSHWNSIIENVSSFIKSGGQARWDWLVFEHNKHQIEQARRLSQQLGFVAFNRKQTARFISEHNYRTNVSNHLAKHNKNVRRFEAIVKKYGSWNEYVNKTPISCKSRALRSIYIDFEADLWPCCWLGAPKYLPKPNLQREQLEHIFARYGHKFNNLRQHSLEDILSHPWFQSHLLTSWGKTLDDKNFKLYTCGRTCGGEYEFSGIRGTSNSEIQLNQL